MGGFNPDGSKPKPVIRLDRKPAGSPAAVGPGPIATLVANRFTHYDREFRPLCARCGDTPEGYGKRAMFWDHWHKKPFCARCCMSVLTSAQIQKLLEEAL